MSDIATAPDISGMEIPIDSWTQPFWDAAAEGKLLLPKCGNCGRFRWPPGPFCRHCQEQEVDWVPSGPARIYSFTILHDRQNPAKVQVPALIEFPEADGIRFPAAIVETPVADVRIGAEVNLGWSQAANARVPVFSIERIHKTVRPE
jgi:uncharacterized OB-fold protein